MSALVIRITSASAVCRAGSACRSSWSSPLTASAVAITACSRTSGVIAGSVDTLIDLEEKARRGAIPAFSRVLIETTGLADPGPIIHTLSTDPAIAPLVRLQTVIATADAVNGLDQLDRHAEPARQTALADVILITKADIADAAQTAALKGRLEALNPSAEMREVRHGEIAAEELFRRPHHAPAEASVAAEWLGAEPHHDEREAHHGHVHGAAVRSVSLTLDVPIAWEALYGWLQSLLSLRGAGILRLKGLVNVAGMSRPVVVQAVHHLLHPPVTLVRWPDGDQRTRIVVIAEGLPDGALEDGLQASLEACLGEPARAVV